MADPVVVPLGPAKVDITGVRAGDRNLMTMTLSMGGQPMDLTGMVVTAQARYAANDEEALDAIITIDDAPGGKISIRWPGSLVAAMMGTELKWKGVWDLQVTSPGNDPVTVVAGTFAAEMDVTRP